jgi:hypothetical protein
MVATGALFAMTMLAPLTPSSVRRIGTGAPDEGPDPEVLPAPA